MDAIIVGRTSKEDVLLTLGEPDIVYEKANVYEYHWKKIKGILLVGGGYSGAVAGYSKQYVLRITFDQAGVVRSREVHAHSDLSM